MQRKDQQSCSQRINRKHLKARSRGKTIYEKTVATGARVRLIIGPGSEERKNHHEHQLGDTDSYEPESE
jgi:hypothetical protein